MLKRGETARLTTNQRKTLSELPAQGLDTATAWRINDRLRWRITRFKLVDRRLHQVQAGAYLCGHENDRVLDRRACRRIPLCALGGYTPDDPDIRNSTGMAQTVGLGRGFP